MEVKIHQQDKNRYYFWPLLRCVIREVRVEPDVMEKLVKKMTGLFFRKYYSRNETAISKAILFFVQEVDTLE